ncbi:tyrosine-type recombinase/integrase [Deinococcus sp.]|uniref:tyrosine-type recombinase/integrase n=1 Tax=Deinococcus sp. TaxID=47478 RepID=UPI0025E8C7F6|nr:tyrosine-type recombinase/integrase [Deinococcus sp.]
MAAAVLTRFEQHLREVEDLSSSTLRAYLADLNHFASWCEAQWSGSADDLDFAPEQLTTPLLTRYRSHLQQALNLKPASVNRALVSLKRFCAWAEQAGLAPRNVARAVRFVRLETAAPRGLTEQEEDALVRSVHQHGGLRDVTIIVLMLHTGLRAAETCRIQRRDLTLSKRSGNLTVTGKGNKVRDVPLNATAREVLGRYLPSVQATSSYVFPSDRQRGPISTRALDHLIRKYAHLAKLVISPHDLRHRFGYVMAQQVPLHRLAQIMGHDSLDTTARYTRATQRDLQAEVEKIAWQ